MYPNAIMQLLLYILLEILWLGFKPTPPTAFMFTFHMYVATMEYGCHQMS